MGTTNRAEELAREYAYKNHQEYSGNSYLATDFIAGYNSRQSEIDTITNNVQYYNIVIDDQKREIEELTKSNQSYCQQFEEKCKEVESLRKEMYSEDELRQAIITTIVSDSVKNSTDVDNLIKSIKPPINH